MLGALNAIVDGLSKRSDSAKPHDAAMRMELDELKAELMRQHVAIHTEMEELSAELARMCKIRMDRTGAENLGHQLGITKT